MFSDDADGYQLDGRWKKWFAWYPVQVPLIYSPKTVGEYVWLKSVYRRPFGVSTDSFYWEYGTEFDILRGNNGEQ